MIFIERELKALKEYSEPPDGEGLAVQVASLDTDRGGQRRRMINADTLAALGLSPSAAREQK